MSNLLADIQYGVRALRRNPGFAATAIAALALGIASTTAIFSVVNKVLLEPLPYPDPDRIVQLLTTSPLGNQNVVSFPKYRVWSEHTNSFDSMAAYDLAGPTVNLTEGAFPEPLETARVSADYFKLFGAEVAIGHTFSNRDVQPSADCAAVISHPLWRSRFKASPILVGNTVSFDRAPCKVIGVLAAGFTAGRAIDVWLPLKDDSAAVEHMNRIQVAAHLRPHVTVKMAADDVAKSMQWFLLQYRNSAPLLFEEEFTAIPLRDAIAGDVRPALLLLACAVGFVLLIACANAGSLVLARAARRASEIAVRSALGASRKQLFRQLLIESMLIAVASAVVGLILGFGGVRGLLALSPADLPRAGANGSAIALDGRVFLFTLAVSLSSGVLLGILPAIRASRANLMSLVNNTTVQSGMGFRRGRQGAILVISEVAMALVLLVGAGLLIRTFVAGRTADRGFDEQQVLTVQMSLHGQFARTEQVAEMIRKVEWRMKHSARFEAVATASSLPLEPSLPMPFTVTRHDQSLVGRYHGVASWRSVSPDYFAAFHIRLLQGRLFSNEDAEHTAGVVLISRTMTRKFWPEVDANPIGEYIIIGKGVSTELEDTPRQIVGIVEDVREAGLNREPMMYVPVAQLSNGMSAWINRVLPITWVIRTRSDEVSQALVEHELREASGLPLGRVRTMRQVVTASSARVQFYVLLLTVFGAAALLLVAVGLYGVMSYSVQQRTREIGLRMALGAEPRDIRNMVVCQGMRLVLIGMGVGIAVALALTRVLVSMIFGIRPWDPAVLAGVSVLLAAVALMAAYLPSIRAAEVSPCESLRQ